MKSTLVGEKTQDYPIEQIVFRHRDLIQAGAPDRFLGDYCSRQDHGCPGRIEARNRFGLLESERSQIED